MAEGPAAGQTGLTIQFGADYNGLMRQLDLGGIALHLLRETRAGRRQIATAEALGEAEAPLGRAALISAVEANAGAGCYGARPEATLWADIRSLKRAGLPVRYSRQKGQAGYYLPSREQEAKEEGARLLRAIGWEPSQLEQIRIYAQMSPADKISQMFALRGGQMRAMEPQIRQDQPDITPQEMRQVVLRRLDILREVGY